MSVTFNPGEEKEGIRLTAAEVKKYETRFSQSVVSFPNLQFHESIGKGISSYIIYVHNS